MTPFIVQKPNLVLLPVRLITSWDHVLILIRIPKSFVLENVALKHLKRRGINF